MAIALVGAEWGQTEVAAAGTLTLPVQTVVSGHAVLVSIATRAATPPAVSTISDGLGNSYAKVTALLASSANLELWKGNITTGGSATLLITLAGSAAASASATEWSGMAASPDKLVTSNGAATPATATTVATTASGELIYSAVMCNGNTAPSAGAFVPSTTPHTLATWNSNVSGSALSLQPAWEISGGLWTQQYSATVPTAWVEIIATFKSGGTVLPHTGTGAGHGGSPLPVPIGGAVYGDAAY